MQEREKSHIAKAQQGDKEKLAQILEENKRSYMEYCKKIFRKRIWNRGFISNCMHWFYRSDKEIQIWI